MAGVVVAVAVAPWRAADGGAHERTVGARLTKAVDVVAEPYSSASRAVVRALMVVKRRPSDAVVKLRQPLALV